jgi:hypothetical protein
MIAITTSSSIKVNAHEGRLLAQTKQTESFLFGAYVSSRLTISEWIKHYISSRVLDSALFAAQEEAVS